MSLQTDKNLDQYHKLINHTLLTTLKVAQLKIIKLIANLHQYLAKNEWIFSQIKDLEIVNQMWIMLYWGRIWVLKKIESWNRKTLRNWRNWLLGSNHFGIKWELKFETPFFENNIEFMKK